MIYIELDSNIPALSLAQQVLWLDKGPVCSPTRNGGGRAPWGRRGPDGRAGWPPPCTDICSGWRSLSAAAAAGRRPPGWRETRPPQQFCNNPEYFFYFLFFSVLQIRDVYPGSRIRIFTSRICNKIPKNCFKALGNMIRVVNPGSWFFTHPGSRGQKSTGSRIRNTVSFKNNRQLPLLQQYSHYGTCIFSQ